MNSQNLALLSERCEEIIQRAERDGIIIDNGNVIDLLADNITDCNSLDDFRSALAIAGHGYPQRFAGAINRTCRTRISEWLEALDSHNIYAHSACADDFRARTGLEPSWPTHTVAETFANIKRDPRGGKINGNGDEICCYGYEVAAALAKKYANYDTPKLGRGFQFDDCLEAIRRAGK